MRFLTILLVCLHPLSAAFAEKPTKEPELSIEFRRASFEQREGWKASKLKADEKEIFLHPQAEVDLSDVQTMSVDYKERFDAWLVSIELSNEGSQKMRTLTTEYLNRPLAILVNGEVIMAPVIRTQISKKLQISGLSEKEAKSLVAQFEKHVQKSPDE
jgi:preprotein translocase subunit SecD